MGTGYSGYSSAKDANLLASTAPPKAPTLFHVYSMPENYLNLAKITYKFTRPTKKVLTLTEAMSDDEFSLSTIGQTSGVTHNPNVKVIATAADYTGSLTADDIIQFGSDTTKYIIKSITATHITLTYGLAFTVAPSTDIKLCTKTAESSVDSRTFRVNSMEGNSVDIYHTSADGNTINKWTVTTTLGNFLDLDKILATINEATRQFCREKKYTADTTPILITTGAQALAGQASVTINTAITGILFADDYISFGDTETFYQIDSIVNPTSITLKTNLAITVANAVTIYKKKLLTDDPTPVPYTFTEYQTAVLIRFSGQETLTNLAGYNLYMKETLQSQGSKGTNIKTFTVSDSNLTNNSDGTSTYIYYAPTDTYSGRLMYFALSAYDTEMPTYNESEAALNAYCVSLPEPADVVSVVTDIAGFDITVNYAAITTGSKNPHLLTMMGDNLTPYSVNGGFDIYQKEFTTLDLGQGYYMGIDANNGRLVHPSINANDFVIIRDTSSRHIWVSQSTINGYVELNDTVKTYGTAGISYLTGHSTLNLTAKKATIVKSTDSVLPLTEDVTPTKQYLTEFQSSYLIEDVTGNTEYLIVMESIDTQITYGVV